MRLIEYCDKDQFNKLPESFRDAEIKRKVNKMSAEERYSDDTIRMKSVFCCVYRTTSMYTRPKALHSVSHCACMSIQLYRVVHV